MSALGCDMKVLQPARSVAVGQYPGVSVVQYQTHKRQVIATKASRLLPDIAVAVEADDGNVMTLSGTCVLLPDPRLDQSDSDFTNGSGHLLVSSLGVRNKKRLRSGHDGPPPE
jgi:hypothetical protein